MLAKIGTEKGIMLFGNKRDQTTADFSCLPEPQAARCYPAGVGLTSIDVRQNNIAGDGAVQLAAAVLGNLKIEIFNEIPIKEMRANSLTELDLNGKYVGVRA